MTARQSLLRHGAAGARNNFIRKAVGWALRQFAYAAGAAVQMFRKKERARLWPLSLREAGKHLPNAG